MPRYFFHTDDRTDAEGTELASVEVAKCSAVTLAGKIICEKPERFWDKAEWSMTVTDDRGLTLLQLQIIGTEAPVIMVSRPTTT